MSGTFTSWGALVQALQKEVAEATEEVVDDSLDDLYRNVDRFYSSSEGRYHRTGMLRMSPQSYFSGGGSVSTGEISLNTDTVTVLLEEIQERFTVMLRMVDCWVTVDSGLIQCSESRHTYSSHSAAGFIKK